MLGGCAVCNACPQRFFGKLGMLAVAPYPSAGDAGAEHHYYHAIIKEGKLDITWKYELLLVAKASSFPTLTHTQL